MLTDKNLPYFDTRSAFHPDPGKTQTAQENAAPSSGQPENYILNWQHPDWRTVSGSGHQADQLLKRYPFRMSALTANCI